MIDFPQMKAGFEPPVPLVVKLVGSFLYCTYSIDPKTRPEQSAAVFTSFLVLIPVNPHNWRNDMETVKAIILDTIEYQHWGANTLTISFLIATVLTIISAWGLVQQNQTIWSSKNAKAVSIVWLGYYAILQVTILIYGASIHSAALTINGLLALFYIPLLSGLWKFKGFTITEKILLLTFTMAAAAMALLTYKASFFFAFAIGGLVAASMQPIEIWRKKSAQGLSIKLIGTNILGNIVWFAYGTIVKDWVLISVNVAAFIIFGTTALLWWQYQKETLLVA